MNNIRSSLMVARYSDETSSSVISMVVSNFGYFVERTSNESDREDTPPQEPELLDKSIRQLLWMALPESIVRSQSSKLAAHSQALWNLYFKEQPHDDLLNFLRYD